MKIGIIGWYKHNNYGDERILETIKRFFDGNDFLILDAFDEAYENIDLLNQCDFVLIGGGGLIIRRQNKHKRLIEELKVKFGCIGISIEAKNEDNIEFINAIKEKAEFILVRDKQSQQLLDFHPKVIVTPDLTFLYPFDVIEPVKEEISGLNLISWPYWNFEFLGIQDILMRKVNKVFPGFEKIYPLEKWSPEKIFNIVDKNFSTLVPIPFYFEEKEHIKNDYIALSRFFNKNTPLEFSENLYKNCRYHIGMRFHSLVFACQMGIPFISLTHQPKNLEFCKSLDVENLSVDIFKTGNLQIAIDELKSKHSELREKLLYFREKNHSEVTEAMKDLFKTLVNYSY